MMSTDNFKFDLVTDFPGYISSKDKTNIKEGILVRGSQNVYKKLSGTIASRFGLKRRGSADSTNAGVKASYEYVSSWGETIPIRVVNNTLQFESDIVSSGSYVWYNLLESSTLLSPAATLTRFVFEPWWEWNEQKDRLLMVRGDSNVLHWSGGFAKVSSVGTKTDSVLTATVASGGSGWVSGDIGKRLYIDTGDGLAIVRVLTLSAGAVATIRLEGRGSGYTAGVVGTIGLDSGISGTSLTVTITVGTSYTITKSGTTTWAQSGFATYNFSEKKVYNNGIEYTYLNGESTTTLEGITTDTSSIVNDSLVIQSVFVASLVTEIPDTNFEADFFTIVNNQVCYGSYTSKVIHISASITTGTEYLNTIAPGFSNLVGASNDQVWGDPDYVFMDDVANGIIQAQGSVFVSSGTNTWYKITPNSVPNIAIPFYHDVPSGSNAYVITKVEKLVGSGLCGLYAHEFAANVGDSIIYLSKDQQVRVLGSYRNIFTTKYPSISQAVNDELAEEDFTGGHLRSIGDFIYITAPISGRDYMHQTREYIDLQGNITAERLWHPPQIRGISRFAEIDGVVYGHSNQNPQLYQVWDTNQWSDDSPSGDDLPYTCVARLSYKNIDRTSTGRFDKLFIEGYMANGSYVYGNVYFDYNGSSGIQNIILNTVDSPATFFYGSQLLGIGSSSLGDNPLGDGLNAEPNDQALLQKFRVICDINPVDSFEHQVEVYSNEPYSRWEILALGTNLQQSPSQAVSIRKSS
jgi:hypothetical protein